MSFLGGDVTIAGHAEKKWVVYAVAAGGAVAAYAVYKHHKASASASASASGMVTDPSTGVQYPADGQDPVTGETYSQEIGQYGSVEAADAAVQTEQSSYLGNSGDLYGTGYSASDYSTGTYGATTTVSGSVYTSNSAWAQAATAGLADIGYTGTDVSAALGAYLDSRPLTAEQVAIVQTAIAEYGPPPVGSYSIISQPSGNTTSASTVAVPDVVGDSLVDAQATVRAAGLVYNGPSTGSTVATQSPAAGTQVQPGSTVTVTASKAATGGSGTVPPPQPAQPAQPRTPAPKAPPAPSRIDISRVTPTSISCHWTDVPGATSYKVQVTYQSRTVKDLTAGSYSTTITGLTPDHTYGIHVSSVGAGGTSQPAATWVKTPKS